MAKKKSGEESIYSYFEKVFTDNPRWLRIKSNKKPLAQYRADHGLPDDVPIEASVKNALANKKSQMRKARGLGGKKKEATAAKPALTGAAAARLHLLEEQIDECMATALSLNREALSDVIKLLRNARHSVILQLGSKQNGK